MAEPMDFPLRSLRRSYIRGRAALQLQAFPRFFLSALGPSFLRHFYSAFVADPDGIALVAEDSQGHIHGVVVGTTRPAGCFKRLLLRRWYAFAWSSFHLILGHPSAVPRLLRAVTYRGEVRVEATGALLSSICVDPTGVHGLGRRLLAEFTKRVESAGVSAAYLTTDADRNERENMFYRGAGRDFGGRYETREGRLMNCYIWTLGCQSADRCVD